MNRLLKVFLALSATVTLTAVLMAADEAKAPDGGAASAGEADRQRGERDGGRGLFRGGDRLDLSEEQRQKLAELRKKSEAEFRAILTPEQQAKLDEFRSRRFDFEPEGDGDAADSDNPEKFVAHAIERWDANKDGNLNKEELTKMAEAMAERRGDRVDRRDDRRERRGDGAERRDDRRDDRGERRDDRRDDRDERRDDRAEGAK